MARVRLGEVATERRETYKGSKSGYPVIGLEHLISENINLSMWDESGVNTFTKMFHKGDVLFGRRRAYLKKAVIAPFDGICSGDITVIVARPEYILPELLPFVIQNDEFFDFAVGRSEGSLSPRVKWEYLREYEFDLPDMAEQRKLARVLWAVNDTIEAYRKLMTATEELVRGQLVEMFGGIEKVPLAQMAIITMGQSPSSDSYNTNGEGVPFHQGSGEFTDKYVADAMFCTAPTRMAKAGDVLLSVRAPVGTVNLTSKDCCIGRGLAAIRSKVSPEYNEYLLYALRAMKHKFESMGHGSTVKAINKDELHNIMIPSAELTEQMKFVALSRQADKSKSALQKAISAATAVSKKIISENLG